MKYKSLNNLLSVKIRLLEEFILEVDRLNRLYGWRADPDKLGKIDQLCGQLDNIEEQIKNFR